MQRISNTFLTLALTVFVTAVSLVLLLAAWLMATHVINGQLRSLLPRGLLIGLLAMSIGPATAQIAPGTFVVVEERTRQSDGQTRVSYAVVTVSDTLFPLVVRGNNRFPKRFITPKPAWPDEDFPQAELPDDEAAIGPMYIIGAYPRIPTYRATFRFRRKP